MQSRISRRSLLALASAQAATLLLGACTQGVRLPTPTPTPVRTAPTGTATLPPILGPSNRPATQASPSIPASASAAATASRSAATASPARATADASPAVQQAVKVEVREYLVPRGTTPHDVAPAPDGSVWYTGQLAGELGRLDPATGTIREIKLGQGSAPHGVIVGPDGAPWVTDGGLNAIVRVDPITEKVQLFPLPNSRANASLNTAVFDRAGILWFTGQSGIYGTLNPAAGALQVFSAPRGAGPYGITVTPGGAIYYASLAGNYVGRIDPNTGQVPSSSRPRASRARGASGPTCAGVSGSVSGTPAKSLSTTRRRTTGASGSSPARNRRPTPSTWTTATSSG